MSLPLAYHREDEITRIVAIGEIALAVVLIVIGIALMRRLEGEPAGRNRLARIAAIGVGIGITAYALNRVLPDDPGEAVVALAVTLFFIVLAVGLIGPILAILALARVRHTGERRLAVLTFVASLVLPGVFVANVVACALTDACFH